MESVTILYLKRLSMESFTCSARNTVRRRSIRCCTCSSCNIVGWKSVDTTFTVWWRSEMLLEPLDCIVDQRPYRRLQRWHYRRGDRISFTIRCLVAASSVRYGVHRMMEINTMLYQLFRCLMYCRKSEKRSTVVPLLLIGVSTPRNTGWNSSCCVLIIGITQHASFSSITSSIRFVEEQ